MNLKMPLQYNISSWDQLPQCMSNISVKLNLHVKHIIDAPKLEGTVIRLDHEDYGTLFSCLVDAAGDLLVEESVNNLHEMSTKEILAELTKFGFNIQFNKREHLSAPQLAYLSVLAGLGYDKIRIMNVHTVDLQGNNKFTPYVVAFNIDCNSDWLNNGYSCSWKEFGEALNNGSAINISGMSAKHKFRWDWLDYVASIQDILDDNMGVSYE